MQKKILFVRLDKIGDLICTLCTDDHPDLKEYSKHWLIVKGLEYIPDHSVPKRTYLPLTKDHTGFSDLYHFLKTNSFSASVSFQCPWWVHFLLFYFKIPIRVGVLSQWHSFLFLNAGLRQKRSQALKHEADYNFELVNHLVKKLDPKSARSISESPILILQADPPDTLLKKWDLKPREYFVVHPGMAGSSLNWPQSKYIEFIQLFQAQFPKFKIVMTGTAGDTPYVNEIRAAFDSKSYFLSLQSELNSNELLSLLSASSGLLAPSTGVMHLAASLGVPTFGIFSPVTVQQPLRWGPRGPITITYQPSETIENDPNCMSKLELFTDFKTDFDKIHSTANR